MTAVCLYCQANIEPGAQICPHCGQLLGYLAQRGDDPPAADSSAPTAAVVPVAAAEVAPLPAASGLPHPGLPLSLLLMIGLFVVQCLAAIAAVVIWMVVSLVVGGGAIDEKRLAHEIQTDGLWFVVLLSTAAVVGVAAVVLLIFGRRAPRAFALRGITPIQWLLLLLLPLPAQFVISVVGSWIFPLLPEWLQIEPKMEFVERMSLPLALLAICVFPGVGEEVFFRGLVGRGLLARWGPWRGILLTSFLFGVMHLVPIQVFGTFLLGLMFHLTMVTTRSLLAPILLHAINNGLAVCIARYGSAFPIPGYTSEVGPTPWPMLAAAVLTVAAIAYAMYLTRSRWLLPDGRPWSPGYFSLETPPDGSAARLRSVRTPVWLVLLLLLQFGVFLATTYTTVLAMGGAIELK